MADTLEKLTERAREFNKKWVITEEAFRRPGELLAAWKERQMAAFAGELLEEAADIAGGMTGPGNTPEQCQGYSDACRDIRKAIRQLAGKG